jgi:hypothetical protein
LAPALLLGAVFAPAFIPPGANAVAAPLRKARPLRASSAAGPGTCSNPSAEWNGGTENIFYYGCDGQLWELSYYNNSWHGPGTVPGGSDVPGGPCSDPTAVSGQGSVDIFVVSCSTGEIDEISYNRGQWWGPTPVPNSANLGGVCSNVSAAFNQSGATSEDLFFTACSGLQLVEESFNRGQWWGPSPIP